MKIILAGLLSIVLITSFQNCGNGFTALDSVNEDPSLRIGKASASWSDSAIWRRDSFFEHHVHSGKVVHPACPSGTEEGKPCLSDSTYCQYGDGSSAEVYACGSSGFEVTGYVVDHDTNTPLADALIEFHTGGPVNIFSNYSLRTDRQGKFSASLPAQPRLIYASLEGYEDARNPGLSRARVTIVNNSLDPLVLKRLGGASAQATNKASCDFSSNVILHSHKITAYKYASVESGASCPSETRICNNGTLSGSYSQRACVIKPATTTATTTPPVMAPPETSSASGWGQNRKWSPSVFEVNSVNKGQVVHPNCSSSTTTGSACSSEGAYCQLGAFPNAQVFYCSSSFKVTVTVLDANSRLPIPGVSLQFSTGHTAFPVGGPTAGNTDNSGRFSALYTYRPNIVKATKSGYRSSVSTQKHVSSSINDSGATTIYLTKETTSTMVGQACSYLYKAPVVEVHSQFADLHCGGPYWDGKVKCEYSSGRHTKGDGWGTCQCYKSLPSTFDDTGTCKAVLYDPFLTSQTPPKTTAPIETTPAVAPPVATAPSTSIATHSPPQNTIPKNSFCVASATLKCVNTNLMQASQPRLSYKPDPSAIYAFKISTPATKELKFKRVIATGMSGARASKLLVVSKIPGDTSIEGKDMGCFRQATESTSIELIINPKISNRNLQCVLEPNTIYYINASSRDFKGNLTCTSTSSCGFYFEGG